MSDIETTWASYVATFGDQMDELRARFVAEGYLELPNFGPPEIRGTIDADIAGLLDTHGLKRRVSIVSTGGTPRHMEVVGRDIVVANSTVIPETYHSTALRTFLAEVTKETAIVPVPWAPEEMVISRLAQEGETHGWHWDDYSYAFVWIVKAPTIEDGGALEYVWDTIWNKEDARVEEQLANATIERRHPATGSAYLFRAGAAMHRIAPLIRNGAQRVILCFSYAIPEEVDKDVTHETVDFYSA